MTHICVSREHPLTVAGNDLSPDFFSASSYQITYLEVAACRLSAWPKQFAARMPKLEVLNINYNYLEDLRGLDGMKALRKVMVVGNRLQADARALCHGLKGLEKVEEIDLR